MDQSDVEGGGMNPLLIGGIVDAIGKVADDLFTSDKERHDHVGKHHNVAQRQNRKENTFRKVDHVNTFAGGMRIPAP